ncbi:condensation domain-containing protein, partial [Kitasatospora sp. NPDC087861]|uniref:condensation domain-containing protein n=1 Tax=Kitasatospora sp. NPDC087861 TaxID=3364070 RepID=UPI003816555B
DDTTTSRPALTTTTRPEALPVSYAQQRLWFLSELEGPSPTYNIPLALHLTGHLDTTALDAALHDVVERHEVLRTIYPTVDGHPRQQVRPADSVDRLLTVGAYDATALARATAHTFDLGAELPIRAWLFSHGETEHTLLVVVHHIAGDGWSMGPLAHDISTAYTTRLTGTAPAWEPLTVQYADYTLWQRNLLGSPDDPHSLLSQQLTYWRQTLTDLPDELTLPTDRPRPATASHHGGTTTFAVPAELHQQVVALARAEGVTVFMVLQAAFAVLLSRLGAGTDVPIGTPVAGRTDEALDNLIGFFVNTLVLRTDLSGNPTFTQLLHRIREADLTAFAHQDIPFERLVEEIAPARSMARHPLFQVMLTLQNNTQAALSLPELDATLLPPGELAARFDLDLTLDETFDADGEAAGLNGSLTFARDLFDTETAEQLATRFVRVLKAAGSEPRLPVSHVDVLSPAERRQVLEGWNDTAAVVPAGTLPELFEARVAQTPDAVAVVFEDESLTYAELNTRANQVAHLLTKQGVGPETVVPVLMERSIEMVTALLGILKAGGAYLPVDPDYPAERIDYLLNQTDSPVTVTETLVDKACDHDSTDLPHPGLSPDHPAYVIFTSGSTGRPKGVVVPHAGIVNRLTWMQHAYSLTADDRVLQKTPFGFDVSVWEFFWTLLEGATLVIARPGGHREPAYLAKLIQD